jgi:hypothetical protein
MIGIKKPVRGNRFIERPGPLAVLSFFASNVHRNEGGELSSLTAMNTPTARDAPFSLWKTTLFPNV